MRKFAKPLNFLGTGLGEGSVDLSKFAKSIELTELGAVGEVLYKRPILNFSEKEPSFKDASFKSEDGVITFHGKKSVSPLFFKWTDKAIDAPKYKTNPLVLETLFDDQS